eukprot:1161279-Pelagomonas_calceolata.AAC.5
MLPFQKVNIVCVCVRACVQVGEAVLSMVLGADAKSWSVQGLSTPSQPAPGATCSITAGAPALLLPAAPAHTTTAATATPSLDHPSSDGPTGPSITLRASVCVPAHMSGLMLMGWGGDAAQEAAAEGSSDQGVTEEPLQVLVNVKGHGYVPTAVRALSASPLAPPAAAGHANTQVAVEVRSSPCT